MQRSIPGTMDSYYTCWARVAFAAAGRQHLRPLQAMATVRVRGDEKSTAGSVLAAVWLQLVRRGAAWMGGRRCRRAFSVVWIPGRVALHAEIRQRWAEPVRHLPLAAPSTLDLAKVFLARCRIVPGWHLMRLPGWFHRNITIKTE